jgi:hypothetical protein
MVPRLYPARGRANLFDDPGSLVPQHHRHGIAQRSFDHLEVGVAKSRSANPHQHVGRPESGGGNGFD